MKHQFLRSCLVLLAWCGIDTLSAASETSFTYQGQLEQNGSSVTAQCDFLFSLWTDNNNPNPGTQVGGEVQLTADVNDGIFTADLDFGTSPLDGSARWLNIAVCCPAACAGSYTELVPRQFLSAAPYSVTTRGIYVDASENVGIRNSNPNAMLAVGTGDGASLEVGAAPQLNLSKDSVDDKFRVQLSGSGYSGYDLQIGRDDAGHDIILSGDVGIPGVVGIGTLTPNPQTSLHINAANDNFGVLVEAVGTASSRIGLHAGSSGFSSLAKNAYYESGEWQRMNTGFGAYLLEVEPDGDTTISAAPSGGLVINWNRAMVIKADGKVGMGTNSPATKLHVGGDVQIDGALSAGIVRVQQTCPGQNSCIVPCPAGTKVIGGGCAADSDEWLEISIPLTSEGWLCGPDTDSDILTARAVCANVALVQDNWTN